MFFGFAYLILTILTLDVRQQTDVADTHTDECGESRERQEELLFRPILYAKFAPDAGWQRIT